MGSESEDVEPSGALWLDDHCNLWVGDEVKQVGGDDEGGEGVLRLVPVPHILLLLSFEGEEQARHTAGYQTTPVWVLWQLTNGLLSIFAPKKGRGRWRQCQCQCELEDKSGHWTTLVDGDTVGDTVTGVHDDTSGTAGGVQGEHSLDGDVHGGHVEGLEHDLGHLLPVGLGVEGSLSQEDGLLLGGNAKLVVEGVVPDLLHVIPVGDDSVLNGVLQGEDTPLGLGLVTDVGVLLSHTDHDTLVAGTSDNGGEDGPGGVVSGEAGLAHAGAIVADKSSNVLVTHLGFVDLLAASLVLSPTFSELPMFSGLIPR